MTLRQRISAARIRSTMHQKQSVTFYRRGFFDATRQLEKRANLSPEPATSIMERAVRSYDALYEDPLN
jgi:hypothetical protein